MAPTDPAEARVGGRFQPLQLLGRGASGDVFVALDHHLGGHVALKCYTAATAGAFDDRAAFEREVAALRRLHHPDVAAVVDAGVGPRGPWLASTLAPGVELSRYASAARRLPEPVVLEIASRLAGALAHAHAQGVVHRDLKPANVRVQWHGGALSRLTLLDFGLAAGSDFSATRSGVVPGTPAYMAPELLAGAPPTPASDLYALGVCLFQLLAGRLPHDAPTLGALLLSVTRDDAPALRSIEPAVGEGVSSLVAGLLARAPGQRPARAAEVATRLERERGRALPPAPDVTTMSVLPRQPP